MYIESQNLLPLQREFQGIIELYKVPANRQLSKHWTANLAGQRLDIENWNMEDHRSSNSIKSPAWATLARPGRVIRHSEFPHVHEASVSTVVQPSIINPCKSSVADHQAQPGPQGISRVQSPLLIGKSILVKALVLTKFLLDQSRH